MKKIKISILIPCHNEEKSIRRCIESCLNQTRPADQILVVNDGSTDKSGEILASFGDGIEVLSIPVATGNKSFAQQRGLKLVTGDVFIATDGDTIMDKHFVERIEKDLRDPTVMAVGGYVKSLKYNWLTACRELDYVIGQNLHKLAQSYMDFMFVIPGCAGAFRTKFFKKFITFDHDTVTEDLDFTYRYHVAGHKILYNRKAIVYTQDPATISSYTNQMRRWYAGGWQNLLKHYRIVSQPLKAVELTLMYVEGLTFSFLLFLVPILNPWFAAVMFIPYFGFLGLVAIYGAFKSKRIDLIYFAPAYILLTFINAWVFMEQFVQEIVIGNKTLIWFQPERVEIS